ncbi:hypothetical protein D3C87_2149400 [compost metagenome]
MPQLSTTLAVDPSGASVVRLAQVAVHSQTLPAMSITPMSLAPKKPLGCGIASAGTARLASCS